MINVKISISKKEPPAALPVGYSLYQFGDDFKVLGGGRECASGGCPAVMVLNDNPDTDFTEQWQYFVYAINKEMSLNAIIALMGWQKALMNNNGFGNPNNPKANYLTRNNLDKSVPKLDKLRTFGLNTHACKLEGNLLRVLTFDGNQNPPLKAGRSYPKSKEQANLEDYLYTPQTHRWMFLDCSNVKWKKIDGYGNFLAYGPFDNGVRRVWTGDNEIHSFFPLVSKFTTYSAAKNWSRVTTFPSPFRRNP